MLRVRNVPGEDHSRPSVQPSSSFNQSFNQQADVAGPSGFRRKNYHDHEKKKPPISHHISFRVIVILGLAIGITALAYWVTPNDNVLKQEADHVAQAAMAAEHELEREMMEWWSQHGHQKPPALQNDLSDTSHDAPLGANRWVEGEKKLKQKLKMLAERQQQGKDIGVPVLTRWLGDDIPAWAGEGVDVDEWKQKVEDKYTEMRQDEVGWQREIALLLGREKHRG